MTVDDVIREFIQKSGKYTDAQMKLIMDKTDDPQAAVYGKGEITEEQAEELRGIMAGLLRMDGATLKQMLAMYQARERRYSVVN